jgi:FixJ family two-component response regulator
MLELMLNREVQTQGAETTAVAGIVHIVDDDEALRAALLRLVRSDNLDAVGHANAGQLRGSLSADVPSCIVLDIRLRDENGLNVQETLRTEGCTAPVIFLTGFGTIPMSVQAMRGGAAEFLTKPVDDIVLLDAIRRALEFDASTALRRRSMSELAHRLSSLTDREREVMELAIGGLMNKQIAGELGTTEITAKVHKRRVMDKMGARSLPDLVRMAETLGVSAIRTR